MRRVFPFAAAIAGSVTITLQAELECTIVEEEELECTIEVD